jgi:hypothetical protein
MNSLENLNVFFFLQLSISIGNETLLQAVENEGIAVMLCWPRRTVYFFTACCLTFQVPGTKKD